MRLHARHSQIEVVSEGKLMSKPIRFIGEEVEPYHPIIEALPNFFMHSIIRTSIIVAIY